MPPRRRILLENAKVLVTPGGTILLGLPWRSCASSGWSGITSDFSFSGLGNYRVDVGMSRVELDSHDSYQWHLGCCRSSNSQASTRHCTSSSTWICLCPRFLSGLLGVCALMTLSWLTVFLASGSSFAQHQSHRTGSSGPRESEGLARLPVSR